MNEYGNLEFDQRVLAAQLAELLAAPRMAVAAALSRLERRDLL